MKLFNKNLNKDILYIAEIGVNHEGSIARCKKIIKQAKEAGADVVKFQCFTPEKYVMTFCIQSLTKAALHMISSTMRVCGVN